MSTFSFTAGEVMIWQGRRQSEGCRPCPTVRPSCAGIMVAGSLADWDGRPIARRSSLRPTGRCRSSGADHSGQRAGPPPAQSRWRMSAGAGAFLRRDRFGAQRLHLPRGRHLSLASRIRTRAWPYQLGGRAPHGPTRASRFSELSCALRSHGGGPQSSPKWNARLGPEARVIDWKTLNRNLFAALSMPEAGDCHAALSSSWWLPLTSSPRSMLIVLQSARDRNPQLDGRARCYAAAGLSGAGTFVGFAGTGLGILYAWPSAGWPRSTLSARPQGCT